MASVSESQFGAGGKIVSNRRKKRLAVTPYDRPLPPPPARSPNWFSGVIIPSARAIASGAGKILSSVLYSDSSSSSEDDGSDSEEDVENDNYIKAPSDGINELNKGTSSEVIQPRLGSHSRVRKSETKHIIEQLIMQEMFSREERERLIKLINSRVVDYSTMEAGDTSLLTVSPGETVGNKNVDLCNRTVMGAKMWLEEKKVRSSPVSDLAHGTCGFNSTMLENVESEVGSPVDMAKSYMKARPPWASPTKQIEARTPSTMTMEPFKEGTQYSVGNDSLSTLKKRNSLASGSWNIQEELRRVRSKATDDMLRSLSSKIDLSLAPKSSLEYLGTDISAASIQEKKRELNSSSVTKLIDAPTNLDAGVRSNLGLSGLNSREDGGVNEMLSSKPTTFVTGNNEDSEAVRIDGECTASKPPQPTSPNHVVEHHDDPHSRDVNGSMTNKETELGRKQSSDGYPSSQTSLSARVGAGENDGPSDEGNHNNTVSQKNLPLEDKCELLSETYIEVPILADLNSVPTGSQNSFSMQHDEFSIELTQPAKKHELAEKADGMAGKQQGKKSVKFNRRGRGRGK
ncbi:protein KAKU4-like [Forsythia ovata]|uniref:Protein KAKU4-like n=1 Tax=Forsythia ovata TaxID=205694 RepID=A0ABD1WEN9_9LAMI